MSKSEKIIALSCFGIVVLCIGWYLNDRGVQNDEMIRGLRKELEMARERELALIASKEVECKRSIASSRRRCSVVIAELKNEINRLKIKDDTITPGELLDKGLMLRRREG